MTPELDRLQIKEELLVERRETAQNLGLRLEVCIEQEADHMDRAQAAEAREIAIRMLDRSACRFHQVEDALRRLANGVYGICVNCEEEIGPRRLRAVPWTPLCLKCQEIADQGELNHRAHDGADFLNAA